MLKKNIIFSLILFSTLITTSLLCALAPETAPNLSNQSDNTLNAISRPKSSAAKVTEKWYNDDAPIDIKQVVISADGKYIAASYVSSRNVTLFHRDSNSSIWEFEAAANIDEIAISWNGSYIVACDDTNVYLLNSTAENPKTTMWNFTYISNRDYSVDISLDGRYIAVGIAEDGMGVYLLNNSYSSQNKKEVWHQVYSGPTPHPNHVTISGDGNYTVIGGNGNPWVDVYNETKINPKPREWRYDTTAAIQDVEISHSGDYFIAANNDWEVYLFNTTDYLGIPVWNFTETAGFKGMAISADGNYSVVAFGKSVYYFNNTFSGVNSQKQPHWVFNTDTTVRDLDISGDGKYVVVATQSMGTLYLLNDIKITPKTEIWKGYEDDKVNDVSISGFGDYFAAGMNLPGHDRISLFHHDISIPSIPPGLLPGDDDDDDDEEAIIPFGNYYLLFALLAMLSLIVIMKRKAIFKEL
ncbi:MAG: WD40 repeat domain-containing protein [Candidatus Hodarchaeota archaeon]